jgi:hypothetical protein
MQVYLSFFSPPTETWRYNFKLGHDHFLSTLMLTWLLNVRGNCISFIKVFLDSLCGLVVKVPGYRSGGPSSIPGTTKKKKSSVSGTGYTQPREYN